MSSFFKFWPPKSFTFKICFIFKNKSLVRWNLQRTSLYRAQRFRPRRNRWYRRPVRRLLRVCLRQLDQAKSHAEREAELGDAEQTIRADQRGCKSDARNADWKTAGSAVCERNSEYLSRLSEHGGDQLPRRAASAGFFGRAFWRMVLEFGENNDASRQSCKYAKLSEPSRLN